MQKKLGGGGMLGMGQHMQRLWQHLKGYYDKVIAFLI